MTTRTLTVTDFLLARIAEDETEATRGLHLAKMGYDEAGEPWNVPPGAWLPSSVLAECDAKRRTVRLCDDYNGDSLLGDEVLRLLALPYADHPDYRDAWRP